MSLGFYPIKCSLKLSFYQEVWGTVALPLALILSFCCLEGLYGLLQRQQRRRGFSRQLGTALIFILFLVYPR